MQHLPFGRQRKPISARPAVEAVPHDRMPDMRHVHADLVGAAGFNPDPDQRTLPESLLEPVFRHRLTPPLLQDRLLFAVDRMPADPGFYPSRRRRRSPDQGQILLFRKTILELSLQRFHGRPCFGGHHDAAGILIEPVNEAGPIQLRKDRIMKKQRIDQCARSVSGRRMHDQSRWFIDHDNGMVFIEDIKRDRLRKRFVRRGLGQLPVDAVADLQFMVRLAVLAVYLHQTLCNERLPMRTRCLR